MPAFAKKPVTWETARRIARACGIDLVLTTGSLSEKLADGAGRKGRWFESREALIAALPGLLRRGDTVLVKASRSMRFEEITAALDAL